MQVDLLCPSSSKQLLGAVMVQSICTHHIRHIGADFITSATGCDDPAQFVGSESHGVAFFEHLRGRDVVGEVATTERLTVGSTLN